jgi:uncharacterized membrane protein
VLISDVIAAIGFGCIVLGLSLKANARTLGIAGILIMALHGLFPLIPFSKDSILQEILSPLFSVQVFMPSADTRLVIAYPPIPWLGIMLTGYAFGKLFTLETEKRKSIFLKTGLASIFLFIIIRWINVYGDPFPWSNQTSGLFSFLSFINVTKYPPSLSFCLVTLGMMFLVLYFTEGLSNRLASIAIVFGKTPFVYFVVLVYCTILLHGFCGFWMEGPQFR